MSCDAPLFVVERRLGALKPDIEINWYDDHGNLVPFQGDSFRLRMGLTADGPHLVEKTSNIAGANTAPNVVITFDTPDFASLVADTPYVCQLVCTSDGNRPLPDFVMVFTPAES